MVKWNKWSKWISIAVLVCFGIGFSALVLMLSFDQIFLQYLFLVGIYGGTFLGLIAHTIREKIEERG
jgi:Na+/H+ antiporter NhaC